MADFFSENDIILQPVVATIPCSVVLKVLLAAQSNTAQSRSCAPTRPPVFGQTPQSTLRARKILCGQNVMNMVICQMPTIACNLQEAYLGGLYQKGGSNYYCLLDLLSKVQWVLVENSVLVPLPSVMHSHSRYYP